MKKMALAAIVAVLSIGFADAQVGIQAGYNSSTNVSDKITVNGFHVGPVFNLSIQGPISLQYGLLYNYLTGKTEKTVLGITGTSTTTAHRLDLPVRVSASFPFGNGLSAFVFGGPNFNWAFSQTTSGTIAVGGVELSDNGKNIYSLTMSNGKKQFSPFDLQLGIGGGIQYNNIGVRVSYDWGMLDRDNSDSHIWKNNDLKASLFYYF